MARPQTKRHVLLENAACLDLYRLIRQGDVHLECSGLTSVDISQRYVRASAGRVMIDYNLQDANGGWMRLD
jgi:hypothetical protein